ncbi:MAG: ankyrin repeat domain-containing protein [Ignavibacteriae bacterium]|nr:ankyrin repeat domain-containing protein [Ignavibacteriota bacterium]
MNKQLKVLLLITILITSIIYFASFWNNNENQPHAENVNKVNNKVEELTKTQINKNLHNGKQLSEECLDSEEALTLVENVKKESVKQLKTLLKLLRESNLNKSQQEKIIQKIGIPIMGFRQLTAWHGQNNYSDLNPVIGKIIPLDSTTKTNYTQYLLTQNYESIITQINNGSLTNQNIINGRSILSNTIIQAKDINTYTIERLVNAGLTPHFSDLVELTEANMPLDIIRLIVSYNTDDINQSWYNHYRKNTLTMIAAKNINYPVFNFWVKQGVLSSTDKKDFTALDTLSEPSNEKELAEANQIFIELALQNVVPYDIKTLEKIKKWLPKETLKRFGNYFTNEREAVLDEFEMRISEEFSTSFQIQKRKLEDAIKQEKLCNELGINNNIVTNIITERLKEVENNKRTKEDSNLPDNPIKLNNKTKKLIIELRAMRKNKAWDDYLAISDKLAQELNSTEVHTMSILSALEDNVPIEIILELLDRGATMPLNAIIILAITGNIELTKKLLPYGLDLYFKDNENRNALYFSVKHDDSYEMFNFLLKSNVAITKEVDLISILMRKRTINIVPKVKELLIRGHKILPIHYTIIDNIRDTNSSLYDELHILFN